MVDPSRNEVFVHNLLTRESEFGKVAVPYDGSVRVRVEGDEVRRSLFIHTIGICVQADRKLSRRARLEGSAPEDSSRAPSPCRLGRYSVDNGDALGLPDSFKVSEEECPVLDDRPPTAPPKLVPLKGAFGAVGSSKSSVRPVCLLRRNS